MISKRNNCNIAVGLFLISVFWLVSHHLILSPGSRIRFVTEQLINVEPQECLRTITFDSGISTIICIKPFEKGHNQEDLVISKAIKKTGAWEKDIVNNVIRAVNKFPDATFLDLGCNIGQYTLVVAAMGRDVVAVDAMVNNLELVRKSLELINKQSRTRLIHNSVSDGYETLYPYEPVGPGINPGGITMKTWQQVQQDNLNITLPPVESVKLRDILDIIPSRTVILKIDIENYECKALQPEIIQNQIGKFIPYIFMEWYRLPEDSINCPLYLDWVEIFFESGYIAVNPANTNEEIDWEAFFIDVLWIHKSVRDL